MSSSAEEGWNTAQEKGRGGGDAAKGVGGNAALVGEGAERKRRGRTHPSRKGENQKENARTFASKMVEDADRERLKGQIEGRRKKRITWEWRTRRRRPRVWKEGELEGIEG